jgi:hypothetical protein
LISKGWEVAQTCTNLQKEVDETIAKQEKKKKKTHVGVVQRVSKKNSIASGSGLAQLVLSDGLGTFIVGFLSDNGQGRRKNRRVAVSYAICCQDGEIAKMGRICVFVS